MLTTTMRKRNDSQSSGWRTLSAWKFYIGTEIVVTGGKVWSVCEDPRKDYSHLSRSEDGDHVFTCGDEIRETIKTRTEDMELWVQ